jgi:hypothetical protein
MRLGAPNALSHARSLCVWQKPVNQTSMTILDNNADQDIMRLWGIIGELSEELNRNRALSVTLYGQVGNLKVCRLVDLTVTSYRRHQNQASHSRTGFVLRRFNLDKPKGL